MKGLAPFCFDAFEGALAWRSEAVRVVTKKPGDCSCVNQCSFYPHPPTPSPARGRGGERRWRGLASVSAETRGKKVGGASLLFAR